MPSRTTSRSRAPTGPCARRRRSRARSRSRTRRARPDRAIGRRGGGRRRARSGRRARRGRSRATSAGIDKVVRESDAAGETAATPPAGEERPPASRRRAAPTAAATVLPPTSAPAPTPSPFPKVEEPTEYSIGAEDIVRVAVLGHEDLTQTVVVQPDGTFIYPLIGRVKAADLTPEGARAQDHDAAGPGLRAQPAGHRVGAGVPEQDGVRGRRGVAARAASL